MDIREKETVWTKIRRLGSAVLPFCVVALVIVLVVWPLGRKIADRKQALAQRQAEAKPVEKPLTNVVTMVMEPGLIMERISLPGMARPWISLEVVSEIRGKVVDKKAMEGSHVRKGDVLALIDDKDYQNAYTAALAAYEIALATEKRLNALARNNFATQSQFDDAAARVKTSRAELENARLNLSRCTLVSPMEGVVDRVLVENGTYLNPGDPVVQILRIDQLKIQVGIPESDVDTVRRLKTFDMTIDALGGRTVTGEYHYLYKTTDSMARLYTLEIRVANADGQILPDMFARVEIIKQKDDRGLAVPIYSLLTTGPDTGVFVVSEGQARFRAVETGFLDGWKIQVKKGLEPGDQVVVVGHRLIEDGEKVHVTRVVRDMEEVTP